MAKQEISDKVYASIQNFDTALIGKHNKRDENAKAYIDMYNLEDKDLDTLASGVAKHIRKTIHPLPKIAADGVTRLIRSSDVEFTMPLAENAYATEDLTERMEAACQSILAQSGAVRGIGVHEEGALSGTLFDEIHVAITYLKDAVDALPPEASEDYSSGEAYRVRRLYKRTPVLFEVLPAQNCYPFWDQYGLAAHVAVIKMRNAEIIQRYGAVGKKAVGEADLFDTSTIRRHWDLTWQCEYIEGGEEPLIKQKHKLPRIPIAVRLVNGSRLFPEPENQRQSFLYTLYKSNITKRMNMIFTHWATAIEHFGLKVPMFWNKTPDAAVGEEPTLDFAGEGGSLILNPPPGWRPELWNLSGLINPDTFNFMSQLYAIGIDSTVHRQILGAELGDRATFSATALLYQAGQLPLVPIIKALEYVLADACEIAFDLMRVAGIEGGVETFTANLPTNMIGYGEMQTAQVSIDPLEIPEDFVLRCKVQPQKPGGDIQAINEYNMLVNGGGASREWAREHSLGIGKSAKMDEQIWAERWSDSYSLIFQEELTMFWRQMFQAMQQQKQAIQAGGAGGTTTGGMQDGNMPPAQLEGSGAGIATPEQAAAGAAAGGMPLVGGA